MVPGTSVKSSKEALRLTRLYPGSIYSTAGMCLRADGCFVAIYKWPTELQVSIRMIQSQLLKSRRAGKSMNRLQINRNALRLDRVALTINVTFPNRMCRKQYSKGNCNWLLNFTNRS